jgi:hypothetical protein
MINVTEREQKKNKGWIGSRKTANLCNGQSAAKLSTKRERSTNRGRVSLINFVVENLTFIMDVLIQLKVILILAHYPKNITQSG